MADDHTQRVFYTSYIDANAPIHHRKENMHTHEQIHTYINKLTYTDTHTHTHTHMCPHKVIWFTGGN